MKYFGLHNLLGFVFLVGFLTVVGLFIIGPWAVAAGVAVVGVCGFLCAVGDNRRAAQAKSKTV